MPTSVWRTASAHARLKLSEAHEDCPTSHTAKLTPSRAADSGPVHLGRGCEKLDCMAVEASNPASTTRPSRSRHSIPASDMVLLRTLVGLRWAGVASTIAALAVSNDDIHRAAPAYAVATAALAWTAGTALALRRDPELLLGWPAILIETAIASGLQLADGWSLGAHYTWFAPALGALWSLAAPMTAGVLRGPVAGAGVGVAVVGARLLGAFAPDVNANVGFGDLTDDVIPRLVPTLSLGVLYVMAGLGTAYLADRQRRAEAAVATARAREELAQGLHDGVLQNLVAIGRRNEDPTSAHLARETERDLRRFLFGRPTPDPRRLDEALADAAREFARQFDLTPEIVIDPEIRALDAERTTAVAGAVAEALTNVGKHAGASRVVIYAGPPDDGDGVFVSVKDDGAGFDPDAPSDGRGLEGSIRARVAAVGGRVEIRSRMGQGSEVCLWVS